MQKTMNHLSHLKKALQSIERGTFDQVARRIAKDNTYSDNDLNNKFARLRKDYPIYDELCCMIQADGKPMLEETLIHAAGMEIALRTLIQIAEDSQAS